MTLISGFILGGSAVVPPTAAPAAAAATEEGEVAADAPIAASAFIGVVGEEEAGVSGARFPVAFGPVLISVVVIVDCPLDVKEASDDDDRQSG